MRRSLRRRENNEPRAATWKKKIEPAVAAGFAFIRTQTLDHIKCLRRSCVSDNAEKDSAEPKTSATEGKSSFDELDRITIDPTLPFVLLVRCYSR